MKFVVFMVLLSVPVVAIAAPKSTEDIFVRAEKYTLELRAEITIPFIQDDMGSYGGTGFLIDKKKGWILTNAHVVGQSPSSVRGRFKKTEYHNLKKIYIDPIVDLAVLQIDPEMIPDDSTEAHLDCKADPKTGHPVGTYGHPWEVSFVATRGIVSGTTYLADEEWLQVDAPINHGNSGGPLISMESGLIVAISSATAAADDTEGLNFALPIKYACTIVELLEKDKDPSPPDLGVIFYLHNDKDHLKVANVLNTGTGMEVGDVIETVSGEPVVHKFDVIDLLRGKKQVSAVINRQGDRKDIVWKVKPMSPVLGKRGIYFSGMLLTNNPFKDGELHNLEKAWLVNSTDSSSLAQSEGLGTWDIITAIDGKVFSNIDELYRYLSKKDEGDKINLAVKQITYGYERAFDYYDKELSMEDLKMVVTE